MPDAASTLARPPVPSTDVKRAALLFSGGPAPAANAVISTAADAFLRSGLDAIGIRHGYSGLMAYDGTELKEGEAFLRVRHEGAGTGPARPAASRSARPAPTPASS